MTLKNGFGKCSLFDISKHGLFVFPPKKNLIWKKALFNWPIALHYDVKKVLGHEVFQLKRSVNQPKATCVCITLFLFVCCFRFHFKVIRKSLYKVCKTTFISNIVNFWRAVGGRGVVKFSSDDTCMWLKPVADPDLQTFLQGYGIAVRALLTGLNVLRITYPEWNKIFGVDF